MNDLYPVYIILFSNDTDFGKLIRKATGSEYSHAVIALDSTMNNMYSFSDIPYSRDHVGGAGFVRESLWSPMYRKNKFFTILVTFVSKEERDTIQSKINYFCENHTKFKYNDIGLIQYYLNFKETKKHTEDRKKRWFCSEFVAYMCKAGNVDGFRDIMLSPGDLTNIQNPNVINLGDFTIPKFKESVLIKKTEDARKEFITNQQTTIISESFYYNYTDILQEVSIRDIIKKKKKGYKESDLIPYTSLIDWKYLYDEFIQIFPDTDPNVRFDLYELIIRNFLIPFRRNAKNVTQEIYIEIKNIYKIIGNSIIKAADVAKSIIYVDKKGNTVSYKYPIMGIMNEMCHEINIKKEDYFFE
jgi:hypothetical protein